MKRYPREHIAQAMKVENEEFASRVRSAEAREAFTAFLEKRRPDFTRSREAARAE
jgi:enoyl-CoA hydratase/carnithine racemase